MILIAILFGCDSEKMNEIEGSYELLSGKYITPDTTVLAPGDSSKHIKIFNKTHFATITKNFSLGEKNSFNFGNYNYENNIYKEYVMFSSQNVQIGSSFTFLITIEEEQFKIKGPIADADEENHAWQIEEIWGKIK